MNDQDLCRLIEKFRTDLFNAASERAVINELVTKGTRHHLCRFVAQLEIEQPEAANRFVQGLQDVDCPEHVLRWVKTVRLLEVSSKHSDFVVDLCDLLQAEDKVLAQVIVNDVEAGLEVCDVNVALLSGLCNYRPES